MRWGIHVVGRGLGIRVKEVESEMDVLLAGDEVTVDGVGLLVVLVWIVDRQNTK